MIGSFLIVVAMGGAMLVAGFKDFTTMTIPNWISLFLIGSFFLLLPFTWQGLDVLLEHFAVGGAMFLLGFIMFALGWLGGGDAKLMAATSIWWMWPDLLIYVMYTTLTGGALALIVLSARSYAPVSLVTHPWFFHFMNKEERLPYGVALGIGALLTLPQSNIFQSVIGII